jgi:hypothetical protein
MPYEEKSKLFEELQKSMLPVIQRVSSQNADSALVPVNKELERLEADLKKEVKRLEGVQTNVRETNEQQFSAFSKYMENKLESELSTIYAKVARARADADLKNTKAVERLDAIENKLVTQGNYFDELAQATAMLIENITMQMEAECQDLIDRRTIGLYGGKTQHPIEQDKVEVTKNSPVMKAFGARHRSFAAGL